MGAARGVATHISLFYGSEFIIDDPILRVPYFPDPHLGVAVDSVRDLAPCSADTVGGRSGGNDLDRALDEAVNLG